MEKILQLVCTNISYDGDNIGQRLKMTAEETIQEINALYDKYNVSKSIFLKMTNEKMISSVKGILAELDSKKNSEYSQEDRELIKDIFCSWC